MNYDREIKYMTKQLEKARLNLIYAQSHDNTPQEQIKNLVEKIKIHETILDALEIASHVRHGKWKHYGRNLGECSNCGEIVNIRYNYCPNCGAKMDGKDDE